MIPAETEPPIDKRKLPNKRKRSEFADILTAIDMHKALWNIQAMEETAPATHVTEREYQNGRMPLKNTRGKMPERQRKNQQGRTKIQKRLRVDKRGQAGDCFFCLLFLFLIGK